MKNTLKTLAVSTVLASTVFGSVQAAGPASFSLSPASGSYTVGNSFSIGVYENGTAVNVVTAKLTYDATKLSCSGVGGSSAFPNTISATCGGGSVTISRYTAPGTTVSGTQSVGSISFVAIAPGTAAVSVAAGSQIASNGTNIWNGSTAGGSYSIATAPAGGSGGGSTSGGSNSGGGSTAGSGSTAGHSSSTGSTAQSTNGSTSDVQGAATTAENTSTNSSTANHSENKSTAASADKKAAAVSKTSSAAPKVAVAIVLLAAVITAVWYFLARRNKKAPVPATASASAVKTKTVVKKAPAKKRA
jgi:hypothetical protein